MGKFNDGYFEGFNCVGFVEKALNDNIELLKNQNKEIPEIIKVLNLNGIPEPDDVRDALDRYYKKGKLVIDKKVYLSTKKVA